VDTSGEMKKRETQSNVGDEDMEGNK